MSDSWDEMKRAKEDMYFEEQNRKALERLKVRGTQKPRLSPITGEPMEQVTVQGGVIDRCKSSGGIWLDAGELEQIVEGFKKEGASSRDSWLTGFFGALKK